MWLENYYHLLAWLAFGRGSAPEIKGLNGTAVVPIYTTQARGIAPGYNANYNAYSSSETGSRIVFGTGDTAVTYQDYKLASKWTSNITRVAASSTAPTVDTATGVLSSTLTATVQNSGAADVTITEWGIEADLSINTQSTWNVNPCLIYRDVLANPVTLHQYEAATFTCTLLYQIPNWTAPEQ